MAEVDIEYERLACKTVGLVHPTDRDGYNSRVLDLGHFRIIESPTAAKVVINKYLEKLREVSAEIVEEQEWLSKRLDRHSDPDGLKRRRLGEQFQEAREELVKSRCPDVR